MTKDASRLRCTRRSTGTRTRSSRSASRSGGCRSSASKSSRREARGADARQDRLSRRVGSRSRACVRISRGGRATARRSRCWASSTRWWWRAIRKRIRPPAPRMRAVTTHKRRPAGRGDGPRRRQGGQHLAGRRVFFAVARGGIRRRGVAREPGAGREAGVLGGKPELLGWATSTTSTLDDDPRTSRTEDGKAGVPASNNGCIVKTIRYIGKARNAAGHRTGHQRALRGPDRLMGINAIRETFRDEDTSACNRSSRTVARR